MELHTPNKPDHADRSIVSSCQYHVIFCPKFRRTVLPGAVAERLRALVVEKQQPYGYVVMDMAIQPDHVHLLLDVDPRMGVNAVVGKIKGYTSHALREEYPWLQQRLPTRWTRSKCIASVGAITLDVVQQYIENQKGV